MSFQDQILLSISRCLVASTIPTTAAIIKNNINGLLYNTEDIVALAQAIRTLVTNSDLRYSIVQNNIQQSKKLRAWDNVGPKNYDVILPFLKEYWYHAISYYLVRRSQGYVQRVWGWKYREIRSMTSLLFC